MKKAREIFRKLINLISKPEMRILPGQLAFFLVMSIVPMIALIGTIAIKLNIPTSLITLTINETVPSKFANILTSMITGEGLNFNITVFFISAFFLASNGTHSMIVTSNAIYGIKDRGFIRRRVKAVIMTFFIVFLFTFILIFPLFGTTIINILDLLTKSSITSKIQFIINILRGPLSWLIIFVIIKILYSMAPDENIPSSQTTYGALFTSIGWIISTFIYSFYINNIAQYQVFYGGLTNIIILMLWVYLLAYIFTIGMALNYKNKEERD